MAVMMVGEYKYRVPILIHQEEDTFIAECPLFYVAGQGNTGEEAIDDLAIALKTFMEDKDFEKVYHHKIPEYTPEEVVQKARDLYLEYGESEEELPIFQYTELDICLDHNYKYGIAHAK